MSEETKVNHNHKISVNKSSHLVDPEWAEGPCAEPECDIVRLKRIEREVEISLRHVAQKPNGKHKACWNELRKAFENKT